MGNSAYDNQARRKYLNKIEGQRFLKTLEKLPADEALFCRVMYFTGCRISEALELTQDRVDVADGVLRIRSLKKRKTNVFRRVPIPKALQDALLRTSQSGSNERIFPFSRPTGWRVIKSAMSSAGIEGVQATCKGLRHGFGVRCAMAKVPRNLIQKWMGHASPDTTSIYLDIMDEEERQFIEKTW
jgi:integrase/recombinase XerD